MAIPFFILAGNLMNTGGITDRLVAFAMRTVGHVRGGLAHTTVVTNMIMAGMSGSSVADCAGTGMVLIPAMKKEGYRPEIAAGITASAATIGPIIYIVSNIAGISFWRAVRGTAPFIVPLLVVLALITYFPQIVLWLPRLILD